MRAFEFDSLEDDELLDAQKEMKGRYAKNDFLTDSITSLLSQIP